MDIYALDESFQLITVNVPYSNLQWTRRYYEAGEFSVQVPVKIYDPSWKYIGSSERPELGMIQKILQQGSEYVQVAGYFCEKMLDNKACYPRYIGDAITETAVKKIFEKYKDDLPITFVSNETLLGDRTQSDFSDDLLGTKIYSILESRELSYRVKYDYLENQLYMEVWQGLDRTQTQNVNPWQVFSYEFGTILSDTAELDDSAYKNYAIIPVNADDNGTEQAVYYLDWTNGESKRMQVLDMRSKKPEDGQSDFEACILQEATEKMLSYEKVEDIDVDVVETGYMDDFDLGDKCDIVLTDIGVDLEARIIEVEEVYKDSGHSITIGLGNKRVRSRR